MMGDISGSGGKNYWLMKATIELSRSAGFTNAHSYSLIKKMRGRTSSSGVHSQYFTRIV